MIAGAAQSYAHTGAGISDGSLAGTAHISSSQVQAYNQALSGMQSYRAYGSAVNYLEDQAAAELELVDKALDVFTEVVVDMLAVQKISESLDDIETHANNAGAFLGVAASPEAVSFLENQAASRNLRVEESNLSYSKGSQSVTLTWQTNTRMLEQSSVFLNGTGQLGLNLYVSSADILLAGEESTLYTTGPTALGYQCFVYRKDCAGDGS